MRKLSVLLCTVLVTLSIFNAGPYTCRAYALTEEEAWWLEEARLALQEIIAEREILATLYLCEEYTVRSTPAEDGGKVITVYGGHSVRIQDTVIDDDYRAWVRVSLYADGSEYEGYISRQNIACSDERFLQWEENYGMNPSAVMYATTVSANELRAQEIALFPESYRAALTELAQEHPNWSFVAVRTNLDWNTVINQELQGGKSLIDSSIGDFTKEGAYDDFGWYYATREILEYYMDPRNALTESSIFQFEQLTYNDTYHTQEAVREFLTGTFMENRGTQESYAPGTRMYYDQIIWAVGREVQVSPFHLTARIIQEQGKNGNSSLISGNYDGADGIYKGYYNYFNIGASGKTKTEVIENGLKYAMNATLPDENGVQQPYPWNSAYNSIYGGAHVVAANYINRGQDTLYLQKYNVGPGNYYPLYSHQYMQNIAAPTGESQRIKSLYEKSGALDNTFVFRIPVYDNMPRTACPMPTSSTNVVLEVPSGYDNTTIYVDGVPYLAESRNGRNIATVSGGDARTAVAFKYNENKVPTGMYVWTLEYKNNAYAVTPQPQLQDLMTYHGFSVRVTGKSGIRYKTGVSAALRSQLTASGVNGYTLKEYGTLVMKNENRTSYPMVLGGRKVLSGMSYGVNANGVKEDKIFETVNGRYRYTSVLVGLPAKEYRTEYAFGGYMILEKDGVSTTIYGPVVAKSIYSLAQQIINMGTYPAGSASDRFLRKIIADAESITGQ